MKREEHLPASMGTLTGEAGPTRPPRFACPRASLIARAGTGELDVRAAAEHLPQESRD